MYKHVVVGVAPDHRPGTEAAKAAARHLAGKDGRVTLLSVIENYPVIAEGYVDHGHIEKIRGEVADALKAEAKAMGADAVTVVGHAGRTLLDEAAALGADCIVIASHRPGLSDYFLGSTASYISRHAPCSVHVVREPG